MQDSHDMIVRTSNDVFYRLGFVGVSVEELLSASGLSRGTFYKHFRSKHEAVLAVLAYRAGLFEDAITRRVEQAAGVPALVDALFDALAEWHVVHGARGCLFQTAASEYGRHHADVVRLARDHKVRVRARLETALARAGMRHPRPGAEQLMLLMEGAVALGQLDDQARQIDAARHTASALFG
ncbi:MAG: TetR/AcrR family transcriptional regulator [Salinarimonas sp.]